MRENNYTDHTKLQNAEYQIILFTRVLSAPAIKLKSYEFNDRYKFGTGNNFQNLTIFSRFDKREISFTTNRNTLGNKISYFNYIYILFLGGSNSKVVRLETSNFKVRKSFGLSCF